MKYDVVEHLRRETTRQADEIKQLRQQVDVERARRLRAEQTLAIARGDRDAWAKATAELMSCGVTLAEVEAA